MPTITAAQHFFSSVPAAQSPTGRRGYQSVAWTPGLPHEAVAAIEDRAQYATADGDPIKRQFYTLPGGLAAIAQIVPLAELDEFGRKGRYLAHTLVLDAVTFSGLEQCPLDVLAQFPFASTLDAVFRQIGPGRGQVPTVTFEISPAWRQQALAVAARWPAGSLATLGRLAWRAEELVSRREPVALAGSGAEQLSLLGLLFLLAAPPQRSLLSFDTAVDDCNFGPQVTFWAQGHAAPPAQAKHLLDARPGGRVHSGLQPGGDGPYATWMVRDALPSGLASASSQQVWAASLDRLLASGSAASAGLAGAIPDDFVQRFARVNASSVAERWLAALPQGLSNDLSRTLAGRLAADPGRRLSILVDGLRPQHLVDFMAQALLALGTPPQPGDRKVLEPWIKASADPVLSTLPPFWAGDDKAWAAGLAGLAPQAYADLLASLATWPAPPIPLRKALPSPERRKLSFLKASKPETPADVDRAIAWVYAAVRTVQPAEWDKVLDTLAEIGEPALDAVGGELPSLAPRSQAAIAAWLKGYRGEARALRDALPPDPGRR